MKQFDKIKGYFEPKRLDTLKESAKVYIGEKLIFEALWIIEDGIYKGQWAMLPLCGARMGWVPEEDISNAPSPDSLSD